MNRYEIQSFIKEHGVEGFRQGFDALIEGRTLPNGLVERIDPRKLSLKELWEGCVGSIASTFDNARWRESAGGGALEPTGFPTATEKLLSTVTIRAYESRMKIADRLVPNSDSPPTLTARMIGFTNPESSKSIMPGEQYPRVGIGDKYVTFEEALHNKKEGVEVAVTEEAVRFDQTSQIITRASGVGMSHASDRERRTVRACLGIGSDIGTSVNGVYYPSGIDSPLYSAAQLNLRTDATPIYNHPGQTANSVFADYTDLAEAYEVHAANIRDDRLVGSARPITWSPNVLLGPIALGTTFANTLQATGIVTMPNTGTSSAPEVRTNAPNPLGVVFNGTVPTPYVSAYVDEVSTRMWTLFDNEQTFVRINIFPFATFRAPVGYGWNSDVVFAMRVREWSRVIALDYRMAQRSNGA